MTRPTPPPQPPFTSWPGTNGTLGVLLIVISIWPWSNTHESSLFTGIAAALTATGTYFLAAGAVTRGILAARHHTPPDQTT